VTPKTRGSVLRSLKRANGRGPGRQPAPNYFRHPRGRYFRLSRGRLCGTVYEKRLSQVSTHTPLTHPLPTTFTHGKRSFTSLYAPTVHPPAVYNVYTREAFPLSNLNHAPLNHPLMLYKHVARAGGQGHGGHSSGGGVGVAAGAERCAGQSWACAAELCPEWTDGEAGEPARADLHWHSLPAGLNLRRHAAPHPGVRPGSYCPPTS